MSAELPNGFTLDEPTPEVPEGFTLDKTPEGGLPEGFTLDSEKYSTPMQQVGAGIEGIAQGVAGPVATLAEQGLSKLGVPGLSNEDITEREKANPLTHGLGEAAGLAGSMFLGTGEAALAAKAASKAAEIVKLGEASTAAAKLGAGALKGAIQTGLFQTGDNVTKALLGQGDPNDSVAATLVNGIGPSSILGGMIGGASGLANSGLNALGLQKFGSKIHSFLSGVGESANGSASEKSLARWTDEKAYDKGIKWWHENLGTKIASAGFGIKAAYDVKRGFDEGNLEEGLKKAAYDLAEGLGAKFLIKGLSKPASAVLLKTISNGEFSPRSIFQMVDYGNQVSSGAQKLNKSVENLFKAGGQQLFDKYDFEKNRSKMDDWISNGGITQDLQQEMHNQVAPDQGFAHGGAVEKQEKSPGILHDHPIANVYPEQNIMLQNAKGRVSNYLTNLKPSTNPPRLAFDDEPDQRAQKKSYHRALDIANQPLSVLDKIKKGTIEPEHIKHLNALYPEINGVLQKKITEKISHSQMKDTKPNLRIRQGLSLLLGTPLSGELSPQNIQAAQAVFRNQEQSQPQKEQSAGKSKKGTSSLSKSDQSFLTGNQSLVGRQQRQS